MGNEVLWRFFQLFTVLGMNGLYSSSVMLPSAGRLRILHAVAEEILSIRKFCVRVHCWSCSGVYIVLALQKSEFNTLGSKKAVTAMRHKWIEALLHVI